MLITFFVGAIIPVQAILNARLGKQTGGSLMGALMSFFTGTIALLVLNLIVNGQAMINLQQSVNRPVVHLVRRINRCHFRWIHYMDKSTTRRCTYICTGY